MRVKWGSRGSYGVEKEREREKEKLISNKPSAARLAMKEEKAARCQRSVVVAAAAVASPLRD
jgi:hypothetical protein